MKSKVKVKIKAEMSLGELRELISSSRNSSVNKQLESILEEAESKDANSIISKKLAKEALEKYGDEYYGPECYLFAVRPNEGNINEEDEDEEQFELFICLEWLWYQDGGKLIMDFDILSWMGLGLSEHNLDFIGEDVWTEEFPFVFTGNADEARKKLIEYGFKEKPSLINDYDEWEKSRWSK